MRSNAFAVMLAVTAAIVVAGAVVLSAVIWGRARTALVADSAPGSLQPREPVSPHFVASIERLDVNVFRIVVAPTPDNHGVYLDPGMVKVLVLDEKGDRAAGNMPMAPPQNPDLPDYAIEGVSVEDGPRGPNGTVKWERRTFLVRTHKLPKGTYTVSARVEVSEEGPGAVQGKCFGGAIAARVTNYHTLVVK